MTTQMTMDEIRFAQLTAKSHGHILFANTVFYQTLFTQIYSTPTIIAAMPWKSNPIGGILKGKVYSTTISPYPYFNGKAVYKSLVAYSGPYGYGTTLTDGNGYFVFTDVPYGTYTVSAYSPPGNTGSPEAMVIDIGVTRGVSTNVDLTFGIVVPVELSDFRVLLPNNKSEP